LDVTFNEISNAAENLRKRIENGKSYGLVVVNKSFARTLLRSIIDFSKISDVLIIEPETNIGIDEIRNAINFLEFTPQGDSKFVIIYDADKLTQEAANAFLKTLEEPPAYAVLILVTTRWNSLLPTIRSRLQKLYVKLEISSELNDFQRFIAYWNYDMLRELVGGNYDVLSEDELFESKTEDLSDLTIFMSLKEMFKKNISADLRTFSKFLLRLSKKNDVRFLKITAKAVMWTAFKDERLTLKEKIRLAQVCDSVLKAKVFNFNYQLTYYTLLLNLRGDNL